MSTERYHKLSLLFAYSPKKIAPLSILRKRQVKISPRSLKYYLWILCEQGLQFRHFPEEKKKKQVEIDQFYFLLSFLTAELYMLLYIQQQDRVKYMHGKSLQSCLTLCDPMVSSPHVSSVRGVLQARILEWVAMPSSRGSSRPRD